MTTPDIIQPGAVIRVYLGEKPFDATALGDGWRLLVVARAGRSRVVLLNPMTLRRAVTTRDALARAQAAPVDLPAKSLARRIRRRGRDWRRLGLGYPRATVRDAIAALEGAA